MELHKEFLKHAMQPIVMKCSRTGQKKAVAFGKTQTTRYIGHSHPANERASKAKLKKQRQCWSTTVAKRKDSVKKGISSPQLTYDQALECSSS